MTLRKNTPIDPGRLDKSLRIEEIKERISDGAGGYQEIWGVVPGGEHIWGALVPLRGEERIRAAQQRSNATHRVTIRYREDVNALCRVLWEGNIYVITEPPRSVPDTRHTYQEFDVREEPVEA